MTRRLLCYCSLLVMPLAVQGEYLGDPTSFQVDIDSSGTFGAITLNDTVMDSGYPQQQFANGAELVDGGTVTVDPAGAYYTAYLGESGNPVSYSFRIDVRSVIHGPLALTTAPNSVFEQYFTFTNLTNAPLDLESVAYYRSYLNSESGLEDDTVQQDQPRAIVYSTDGTSTQLAALAAEWTSGSQSWQVGRLGDPDSQIYDGSDPPTAPLKDNTGPYGPANDDPVEMAVGLNAGSVAPGASRTLIYYYLFSTDMTSPPANFPVPAPGALALVGLGLAGLLGARLRGRGGRVGRVG